MSLNPEIDRREFLRLSALSLAALAIPPSIGSEFGLKKEESVLTEDQELFLHEASLKYIAKDEFEAQDVARGIDYMEGSGYEHPSLMCGPLSIAILRDGGLLAVGADVSDFWLPDPKGPDRNLFRQTFPERFYEWIDEKESIGEIDYTQKPLYPGDLIFLRAGNRGSFGHVLVVTRVDAEGRVFSVTNFRTPDGFIVDEVMLYDPKKPSAGKFYEWTDAKNSQLGLTGFGGFYLWRLKDTGFLLPAERYDSLYPKLKEEIDTLLADSKGKWRVLIQDIDGHTIYAKRPDKILHPASVIKIPIALDFFSLMESKGLNLEEILASGTKGRSFDQLLRAMVVDSEEEATEILRSYLQVQPGHSIEQTLQNWRAWHTTTSPRRSTASDTALMLRGLYQGRFLGIEARKKLLGYMSEYTSPDDTRVGILRSRLSFGYNIYNKRGTITSEMLVVADAAIVEIPGNVLTMVFYGYWGEEGATYEKLVATIEKVSLSVYEHLQKASDLEERFFGMK